MRPLELVALQDKQTGAFYYETGEGYIARHIAQLPHGSVIGFRHNNTVLYVFWENAKVTVYRKSDWKDQETRRLAAAGETESHSRGRGYRHLPEHYIDFGPIAEDGTITQEQMDEFMEAWETLKERLSFEQALDSFFAERRNGRSEDIDEMTLSLLEKSSDNAIPPVARELSADELEDPFNEEVLYGNSNSPLDNAGGFARRKRQTSGGHPDDEADRRALGALYDDYKNKKSARSTQSTPTVTTTRPTTRSSTTTMRTSPTSRPTTTTSTTRRSPPPTSTVTTTTTTTRKVTTQVPTSTSGPPSQPGAGRTTTPVPYDWNADEVNSKLNYATWLMQMHIQETFRRVWTQICELHNSQVTTVTAMTRWDPTTGVRLWLRRDDVYATFAGQVLVVTPCTQVTPEEIFWSRKLNATCYHDVPVKLNGSIWFIQSGTRELVKNSREIDCQHLPPVIYQSTEGEYVSSDGNLAQVSSLSHKLTFKHLQKPIEFKARSIFKAGDGLVATSVSLISSYFGRINQMETDIARMLPASTPQLEKVLDSMAGSVSDITSKATEGLKTVSSWSIFSYMTEWYHGVYPVLAIRAVIMLFSACAYTAPWWYPLCTSLMTWRRRQNRRRRNYVKGPIINAVELEETDTSPVKLLGYYPECCQVRVGTRCPCVALPVGLNDVSMKAIIDTGSNLTYLCRSVAIAAMAKVTYSNEYKAATINNALMPMVGIAEVDICFNGTLLAACVFVADDHVALSPVVIGCDVLQALSKLYGAVGLNTVRSTFSFSTVTTRLEKQPDIPLNLSDLSALSSSNEKWVKMPAEAKHNATDGDRLRVSTARRTPSLGLIPEVLVTVNETHSYLALFDSASDVTICRKSVAVGANALIEKISVPPAWTAHRQVMWFKERACLALRFGSYYLHVYAMVVPDEQILMDVLVGMDVFRHISMVSDILFDWTRNAVKFAGQELPILSFSGGKAFCCQLRTTPIPRTVGYSYGLTRAGTRLGQLRVHLTVNGVQTEALVDTGSSVTFCRRSLADEAGLSVINARLPSAIAANGGRIPFLGHAKPLIGYGRASLYHDVRVSEDNHCPAPLILGLDFFNEFPRGRKRISLDLDDKKVWIGQQELAILSAAVVIPETLIRVRLEKSVLLEPRTDNVLQGYVTIDPADTAGEHFVLVSAPHSYPMILVGNVLSHISASGKFPIRVLNCGNSKVTLYRNSTLGYLVPSTDLTVSDSVFVPTVAAKKSSGKTIWRSLPTTMSLGATKDPLNIVSIWKSELRRFSNVLTGLH